MVYRATVRNALDAVLAACYLAAALVLVGSGLPVVAVVVGTGLVLAFQLVRWQVWAWSLVDDPATVEVTDRLRPDLDETVAELSDRMGVRRPRVLLRDDPDPDLLLVSLLGEILLVATRPAASALDRSAIRGLVAHELAHVELSHFWRHRLRTVVPPIAGFAAFWTVFLAAAPPGAAPFGVAAYVGVRALTLTGRFLLLRHALELFVGFVPLLVMAAASRREEYQADAAAVATTSDPPGYARGLLGMARLVDERASVHADEFERSVYTPPYAADRDWLDSLFAEHPPVERRIERLGVPLPDVGATDDAVALP